MYRLDFRVAFSTQGWIRRVPVYDDLRTVLRDIDRLSSGYYPTQSPVYRIIYVRN